ncbi:MAG: hypothetical protein ACI837_001158 [Crocinitomicaceae bacterium]|jgi:hypothetical protein
MKKYIYFFGLIGILGAMTSSTSITYPSVTNGAYKVGEKLKYRVTYGFMDAGEAVIELKSTSKKGAGRALLHAKGTGRTLGGFNAVYAVNDVYQTYIDVKSVMPWYFKRDVNEGGYKINQYYTFKQNHYKVNNGKKDFKVKIATQDMISSFYKARTLNMKGMKKGKTFSFPVFMDDEVFNLKIKYVGDETIKIRKGKFKCHKFVPVVQKGRYFKHEDDVQFWITADQNKIPVMVKAKIPVGVVKLHLIEWSGLKSELSSKL